MGGTDVILQRMALLYDLFITDFLVAILVSLTKQNNFSVLRLLTLLQCSVHRTWRLNRAYTVCKQFIPISIKNVKKNKEKKNN